MINNNMINHTWLPGSGQPFHPVAVDNGDRGRLPGCLVRRDGSARAYRSSDTFLEEDVAEEHRGRMSLPLPRLRCSWCAAVWPTGSSASTCAGRRVICHPARCHPTRCQPARCHQAANHEPVAARLPWLIARLASDPRILPGTNVQAGKTRIASRDPRYPSVLPGETHEYIFAYSAYKVKN